MDNSIIKKILSAPTMPGVYIFCQNKSPLYIGKASNLRSRLRSYLRGLLPISIFRSFSPRSIRRAKKVREDLSSIPSLFSCGSLPNVDEKSSKREIGNSPLKTDNLKTKILHQEANRLQLIKLSSPIEALIKESQLIKILKPKYNILWRDDKNYFYVAFTRENFPKIFLTHQPIQKSRHLDIQSNQSKTHQPFQESRNPAVQPNQFIGPFTDGASLKIALKILRRHFPYCTCRQTHFRQCLNAQIGNCLGVCCLKTNTSFNTLSLILTVDDRQLLVYQNNIRNLKNILLGKNRKFLSRLAPSSEMVAVEKIMNHSPFLESAINPIKIECYDVSNFAGKEAVGAMTTLNQISDDGNQKSNWTINKNDWRKFKIKTSATRNDPQMIAEILERRLNHPEWPYPDLIVIDGGIAQYNAAKEILDKKFPTSNFQLLTPNLLSFAKPNKKIIGLKNLPSKDQNFIKRLSEEKVIEKIISQTHNFVIRYHKQFRKKNFLDNKKPAPAKIFFSPKPERADRLGAEHSNPHLRI